MWAKRVTRGVKNGLFPVCPVEEAGVSAADLSDNEPIISQIPDLAGVAEGVTRLV